MPRPRHGQICFKISHLLGVHLDKSPAGHVVINDSGVVTERNPDTVRGPDIAFYSYAQIPPGPMPRNTYLSAVPELVFEVRSPGDRWLDVQAKTTEYLKAGVKVVCVLDDFTETALVCTAEDPPHKLSGDEEVDFPDLLPDFRVPVRRVFE
jgi:Uma2 family endonuclease